MQAVVSESSPSAIAAFTTPRRSILGKHFWPTRGCLRHNPTLAVYPASRIKQNRAPAQRVNWHTAWPSPLLCSLMPHSFFSFQPAPCGQNVEAATNLGIHMAMGQQGLGVCQPDQFFIASSMPQGQRKRAHQGTISTPKAAPISRPSRPPFKRLAVFIVQL